MWLGMGHRYRDPLCFLSSFRLTELSLATRIHFGPRHYRGPPTHETALRHRMRNELGCIKTCNVCDACHHRYRMPNTRENEVTGLLASEACAGLTHVASRWGLSLSDIHSRRTRVDVHSTFQHLLLWHRRCSCWGIAV